VLVFYGLAEIEELSERLGLLVVQPHVILAKVIIDKLPSVENEVSGAGHYLTEPAEEIRLLLALYHLIKLAERIQILMKSQHGTCELTRVVVDLLGRVYHFLVEDFVGISIVQRVLTKLSSRS
jgi:hypothetical protein